MIALLVDEGRIFEPVAVSYVKTLRSLLSYPPHLEHMDELLWRRLMTVCWATILGERIPDAGSEEPEESEEPDVRDEHSDASPYATAGSSLLLNEIVSLVPILLSSSSAPLIPQLRSKGEEAEPALPAVGVSILNKIHRYIGQLDHGLMSTDVLRALNILMGELELNAGHEFTEVSLKIFPQLAEMWTAKTKGDLGHRELLMVALRTMLPFITHHSVASHKKEGVREAMSNILSAMPKEAGSRAAIKPLDLEMLRFKAGGTKLPAAGTRPPFELAGVTVSFACSALPWCGLRSEEGAQLTPGWFWFRRNTGAQLGGGRAAGGLLLPNLRHFQRVFFLGRVIHANPACS
jgi:ataxia telangiectasia mutated family protein